MSLWEGVDVVGCHLDICSGLFPTEWNDVTGTESLSSTTRTISFGDDKVLEHYQSNCLYYECHYSSTMFLTPLSHTSVRICLRYSKEVLGGIHSFWLSSLSCKRGVLSVSLYPWRKYIHRGMKSLGMASMRRREMEQNIS